MTIKERIEFTERVHRGVAKPDSKQFLEKLLDAHIRFDAKSEAECIEYVEAFIPIIRSAFLEA